MRTESTLFQRHLVESVLIQLHPSAVRPINMHKHRVITDREIFQYLRWAKHELDYCLCPFLL